jgi:hypothetical protein
MGEMHMTHHQRTNRTGKAKAAQVQRPRTPRPAAEGRRVPAPARQAPLAAAIAFALAGAPLPATHAAVGDAVGSVYTVNTTSGTVAYPHVAMGAEGSSVVTWSAETNGAKMARCYAADGTAASGEVTVAATGYEDNTAVAADAAGNSVVLWQDVSTYEVYAQRLDSSCVAQGAVIDAGVANIHARDPDFDVAMAADGRFVITRGTAGGAIYAQRYAADGTPLGSAITVFGSGGDRPILAVRADGGFVVVDYQANSFRFRLYSADGNPSPDTAFTYSPPGTNTVQDVAMDGDGDLVVLWHRLEEYQAYAQRFNASGDTVGGVLGIHDDPAAAVSAGIYMLEDTKHVAIDDDGDFLVAWESYLNATGISAQRIDSADTKAGEVVVSATTGSFTGSFPDVAMDTDGDAVVVWDDGSDIKAQRYEGKSQTVDLDVVASSDASGLITGGEAITYSYTVTNNGSGSALALTLQSAVPPELTFAGISADADWSCTESAGTITCTMPRMVSGGSASVDVSYTNATVSDGNIVNTVTVTTPMSDTDASNDSDSVILATHLNAAPNFDSTPAISGSAAVGNTLSVNSPITEPDGDSYSVAYQWKAGGVAIAGATADSFTVTTAQAHATLTVTLTATDSNGYSTSATATGVAVANAAPTFDATPSISGTGQSGNTLTVVDTATSDTDGDSVTLSYQWRADGAAIAGATASSYTLTSAEAHSDITVTVTAADGYATTAVTTAAVAVGNTAPVISGIGISGSASAGETVTAVVSGMDSDGDALIYSYAWYVDGALVGTAASYTIASEDDGKTIFAIVTVSDGNGGIDFGVSTALVIGSSGSSTTPASSGGGGGALGWLSLLGGLVAFIRSRRRQMTPLTR